MYGKSANVNLNESSVDKGLIVEYPELMDIGENSSAANIEMPMETAITNLSTITTATNNTVHMSFNSTNNNNTNTNITAANTTTNTTMDASTSINPNMSTIMSSTAVSAIGTGITSQSMQSTSDSITSAHSQLPETPTKAIQKQTEMRRADGKRRITPMFIPLNQNDK